MPRWASAVRLAVLWCVPAHSCARRHPAAIIDNSVRLEFYSNLATLILLVYILVINNRLDSHQFHGQSGILLYAPNAIRPEIYKLAEGISIRSTLTSCSCSMEALRVSKRL
jgi:hypothetical protein